MSDVFAQEVLEAHNKLRAQHHCPPLKLSPKLCKISQTYADKLLKRNEMKHSPDDKYGENLFTASSSNKAFKPTGDRAVQSWYSEIKDFKFGNEPPKNVVVGHFTQVIWKGTEELGVGMACKEGKCFVVCNYDPPGNVIGHYAENVPAI